MTSCAPRTQSRLHTQSGSDDRPHAPPEPSMEIDPHLPIRNAPASATTLAISSDARRSDRNVHLGNEKFAPKRGTPGLHGRICRRTCPDQPPNPPGHPSLHHPSQDRRCRLVRRALPLAGVFRDHRPADDSIGRQPVDTAQLRDHQDVHRSFTLRRPQPMAPASISPENQQARDDRRTPPAKSSQHPQPSPERNRHTRHRFSSSGN